MTKRREFSKATKRAALKRCLVSDCDGQLFAKELCQKHYARLLRNGSPTAGRVEDNAAINWLNRHADYTGDECIVFPFSNWGGERKRIWFNGKKTIASRAMCIIAHGSPPTGDHVAAHSCGNGHISCVNPRHLRWATAAENEQDKAMHGTHARGSRVTGSKLSSGEVRIIRQRPGVPLKELAAEFGTSESAISAIRLRKTWAWLED